MVKINHSKYVFANQLRGVACLLVLASHWLGVFKANPSLISFSTGFPVFEVFEYDALSFLVIHEYINFGALGVAIFFLISGFVIPFSLEKLEFKYFLMARFFRLYPVYLVCFSITTMTILFSSRYWETLLPFDFFGVLSNGLLINNLFGIQSIDLVSWTLSVEIKFYLLAVILTKTTFVKNVIAYALFAFLLALCSPLMISVLGESHFRYTLTTLAMEVNFICFMLLGVCFYWHLKQIISTFKFFALSLLILLVFTLSWALGVQADQFYKITLNYLYGYIVFLACYFLRDRFVNVSILSFFANLSYPLYLVHSILGYSLLQIGLYVGIPLSLALVISFGFVVIVAYVVHRWIELSATQFGKLLAQNHSLNGLGKS